VQGVKTLALATTAVAISAVATVNGYRPVAKGYVISIASFAFGMVVSELPLETMAAEATALALTSRTLSARTRRAAWVISALSWLGRLGLHRVGRSADRVLTVSLDQGLGADRRIDPARLWRRPARGGATAKKPGLIRMMRIWRDYAHDADISYGEHGAANHLDIWRRPDLDLGRRAPVLLQIPGGAWSTGNKRGQAHPLMSHLAEYGWICVSMNYRLSPRHTWPAHIVDVKKAIAWVRANIANYGGDPNFIAITGGSAGGHLSALAALTPNDPQFQPGFEDADTQVQAAIPFYGVYDFTRTNDALHPMMVPFLERSVIKQLFAHFPDSFAAASPISYVTPEAPPFFVLHGRNDSFIPVEQARSFVTKLREISTQPTVYAELPLAQHAFDIFGSARATHAAVAVQEFLAVIYASTNMQWGCSRF
jgi:acetyl esterase/lipase